MGGFLTYRNTINDEIISLLSPHTTTLACVLTSASVNSHESSPEE
jgi:hypothetical protein